MGAPEYTSNIETQVFFENHFGRFDRIFNLLDPTGCVSNLNILISKRDFISQWLRLRLTKVESRLHILSLNFEASLPNGCILFAVTQRRAHSA